MKFERFEELVKEKHPTATIFPHGKISGNKINVSIIFSGGCGKVYQYNGTYCDVLNKLGIKSIYKHDYNAIVCALERCIAEHGTEDKFFGGVLDRSAKIEEYRNRLNDLNENYIII